MAAFAFIPEIFAGEIDLRLKETAVYKAITDGRYEGEISKFGDSVNIWTPGAVTTGEYTKNTDYTSPKQQVPDPTEVLLQINQARYFDIFIDALDKRMGRIDPQGAYVEEAAWQHGDFLDQLTLAQYANAHADNKVFPTAKVTPSTILDWIDVCAERINRKSVPRNGRWMTISPTIETMIKAAMRDRETPLGDNVALNGSIGRVGGFDVFSSNNVTVTDTLGTSAGTGSKETHMCVFGGQSAIFLAEAIPIDNMVEYFNPPARFGVGVKGLHLFGLKVSQAGKRLGYLNAYIE